MWTVRLEAADDQFKAMYGWLAPDEVARAERFKFDKHRRAYTLGRAALRSLLAGYLGVSPSDIRFSYGTKGKPSLDDAACGLRFNASNSGIWPSLR